MMQIQYTMNLNPRRFELGTTLSQPNRSIPCVPPRLLPCQQRFLSPCNWLGRQKEKETLSLFLLLAQLITREKRLLPASRERDFSCTVSFGRENKGIINQDHLFRCFKDTPISWKENSNFDLKGKLSQSPFPIFACQVVSPSRLRRSRSRFMARLF